MISKPVHEYVFNVFRPAEYEYHSVFAINPEFQVGWTDDSCGYAYICNWCWIGGLAFQGTIIILESMFNLIT